MPALFLNFLGSFFYFILFADSGFANVLYGATKIMLVVWPFAWLFFFRNLPGFSTSINVKNSLLWGFLSGILILILGLGTFFLFPEFFLSFQPQVQEKVLQMGIEKHYLLFAAGISVFHSLLEEFYWRYFVFRGLMIRSSIIPAAIISSAGFSLHHFVILSQYFPVLLTALFGFFVFLGGLLWCGLYAKTNSFWGNWLSHFFVDVGIFLIGYFILIGSV